VSDNLLLNAGSGGSTLATDDDGTAHHQKVICEWGPEDTQTRVDTGANALPIQDGGNSITVDGTVAVSSIAGTVNVNASGTTVPVSGSVTVSQSTASNLKVDLSGTAANSTAIVVTAAGAVAHDSADSGNPIKIGAKCETSPKGMTLVADGDRTDLICDSDGKLLVKVGTSGADLVSERVTDTTGNSTAFTNFSAVSSTFNYVDAIVVCNSSASTFATVDFRDGTGGSVLYTLPVPASSGVVLPKGSSPYFRTSANTALAYDVSGAVTTITISVSGYQSKV
jgi:hypothetical protein